LSRQASCFYGEVLQPFTNAVIRVYDEAGNVIETHEGAGEFRDSLGRGASDFYESQQLSLAVFGLYRCFLEIILGA